MAVIREKRRYPCRKILLSFHYTPVCHTIEINKKTLRNIHGGLPCQSPRVAARKETAPFIKAQVILVGWAAGQMPQIAR